MHVEVDPPPHVLENEITLRLAACWADHLGPATSSSRFWVFSVQQLL